VFCSRVLLFWVYEWSWFLCDICKFNHIQLHKNVSKQLKSRGMGGGGIEIGTSYSLIDYLLFYIPLKNSSLIWRHHHCRWMSTKFRHICSVLRAFEQGGIFIMPHLLWHRASVSW
jgi:hypothetical protein